MPGNQQARGAAHGRHRRPLPFLPLTAGRAGALPLLSAAGSSAGRGTQRDRLDAAFPHSTDAPAAAVMLMHVRKRRRDPPINKLLRVHLATTRPQQRTWRVGAVERVVHLARALAALGLLALHLLAQLLGIRALPLGQPALGVGRRAGVGWVEAAERGGEVGRCRGLFALAALHKSKPATTGSSRPLQGTGAACTPAPLCSGSTQGQRAATHDAPLWQTRLPLALALLLLCCCHIRPLLLAAGRHRHRWVVGPTPHPGDGCRWSGGHRGMQVKGALQSGGRQAGRHALWSASCRKAATDAFWLLAPIATAHQCWRSLTNQALQLSARCRRPARRAAARLRLGRTRPPDVRSW